MYAESQLKLFLYHYERVDTYQRVQYRFDLEHPFSQSRFIRKNLTLNTFSIPEIVGLGTIHILRNQEEWVGGEAKMITL